MLKSEIKTQKIGKIININMYLQESLENIGTLKTLNLEPSDYTIDQRKDSKNFYNLKSDIWDYI